MGIRDNIVFHPHMILLMAVHSRQASEAREDLLDNRVAQSRSGARQLSAAVELTVAVGDDTTLITRTVDIVEVVTIRVILLLTQRNSAIIVPRDDIVILELELCNVPGIDGVRIQRAALATGTTTGAIADPADAKRVVGLVAVHGRLGNNW